MENIVLYHGNCTDGFGAAYSAWKILGDTAEYHPMTYGQPNPDVTGKNVWILDFSFEKDVYEDMLVKAKSVQLLDHHKSAYQKLCGCKGAFFNLEKSGAMLAWERFNPHEPVPEFIKLIQDGDLYKFKYPETKPFYRAIITLENKFELWKNLENSDFLQNLIEKGRHLEDFWQQQLLDVAVHAKPVEINGQKGLMVNAPGLFASDLGNMLALKCGTYALIWSDRPEQVKCSLRSVAGYDCSLIAQQFGGGGHPQASSFFLKDLAELQEIIKTPKNTMVKHNSI